jgi:hypothetical protein
MSHIVAHNPFDCGFDFERHYQRQCEGQSGAAMVIRRALEIIMKNRQILQG